MTERLLDAAEVAEWLGVPVSWVRESTRSGAMPCVELGRYRRTYAESRRRLVAAANRLGLELIPPEGAFYGFIRLPEPAGLDSLAFCERLIEKRHVVTVPGRAFGESGEGWVRISWVGDPTTVEEGLRRMKLELEG